METKEFDFKGTVLNGFVMVFVSIVMPIVAVWCIYESIVIEDGGWVTGCLVALGIILALCSLLTWGGFLMLEPNTARVTTWFGKYSGTFTRTGFYWINPFYNTKKLSLRAHFSRRCLWPCRRNFVNVHRVQICRMVGKKHGQRS